MSDSSCRAVAVMVLPSPPPLPRRLRYECTSWSPAWPRDTEKKRGHGFLSIRAHRLEAPRPTDSGYRVLVPRMGRVDMDLRASRRAYLLGDDGVDVGTCVGDVVLEQIVVHVRGRQLRHLIVQRHLHRDMGPQKGGKVRAQGGEISRGRARELRHREEERGPQEAKDGSRVDREGILYVQDAWRGGDPPPPAADPAPIYPNTNTHMKRHSAYVS